MARGNIFKIGQQIIRDAKENPVSFGSGLLNEQIYISAYSRLSILDLEKVRYVIDRIIKKKKEIERVRLDAGNLDHMVDSGMAGHEQKSRQ